MGTSNVAQSVRDRLLHRMRDTGENYQALLTRYALERLLYRISVSEAAEALVLKGAYTFLVWEGTPHRPTKDIDFLGYGAPEQLESVFRQVCQVDAEHGDVEEDGVIFDPASVQVEEIRGRDEYGGLRVKLKASIDTASLVLQVDVGFGDAVTPAAEETTFPTLLEGFRAPRLKTYPRETVIAEKLECLVSWGMATTRLKDVYDLGYLAQTFDFEGPVLASAIKATFARRATPIPSATPVALTEAFAHDADKQKQWRAFQNRTFGTPTSGKPTSGKHAGPGNARDDLHTADLHTVIGRLRRFLEPPLTAIRDNETFPREWPAGGPWT